MSPITLTILIFAIMLLLMAIRTPIAISMFIAGATGYVLQAGWMPLASFLNTQAFARFASYDLSVIPLFILMGNFATQGGISKALFSFASIVMSRFNGGDFFKQLGQAFGRELLKRIQLYVNELGQFKDANRSCIVTNG